MNDKNCPGPRIVHLGLGAFFRAHGAIYIDELPPDTVGSWGIIGVSLRSANVRNVMATQGYQYSAVEISENGMKPRKIKSIRNVLVAPEDPTAVLEAMAAVGTKFVSLTITEKGYCRKNNGQGLDLSHPYILHDLTSPLPKSAIGFIVRALDQRRRQGLQPFTVMSLDNLSENGRVIRRLLVEFAEQIDPTLAEWIITKGRFPCTMVDRIVPATTPAMIERLKVETGIIDPAAVFHEPFRQWVIEDNFVDAICPNFTAVGAQMVIDVKPFETMKLRMLNGTHSALAYLGILAGHTTVAEAANDPNLSDFLERIWQAEVIPTLLPQSGAELAAYATALMARYRNPKIRHQLSQIAMDGSQKLPQRILEPLFENLRQQRPYGHLLTVVAAWIRFLQTRPKVEMINDPLAKVLFEAVGRNDDPRQAVQNILKIQQVFGGYPVDLIEQGLRNKLTELTSGPLISALGEGAS